MNWRADYSAHKDHFGTLDMDGTRHDPLRTGGRTTPPKGLFETWLCVDTPPRIFLQTWRGGPPIHTGYGPWAGCPAHRILLQLGLRNIEWINDSTLSHLNVHIGNKWMNRIIWKRFYWWTLEGQRGLPIVDKDSHVVLSMGT